MKDKKIIIESMINVLDYEVNNKKSLTKEWINYRIGLFMNYTLKSLKLQTNQNYIVYVKYTDNTEDLIQEALSKYDKLPANIEFIRNSKYASKLKQDIVGFKKLYLIRLDSDDMYHKSYIQQMYDYVPHKNTKILVNQSGYIYDSIQKRLAKYFYIAPPFYTQIYNTNKFLKGERHWLRIGHKWIVKQPHEIVGVNNFILHAHSNNTRTVFDEKFKKGIIKNKSEVEKILREFIGKG
ncbi:glycosyltransferase family A protein [Oceanirhabdus seepicola]|uniref:Glycosyltransferase family 2 protein n=1 Tax=Oceanirhabdus seepicola TaxID=2828781 RepID=A0A9J6NYF6_9CLOT|nr:glycosyltransferase family A protein [Oceanirhabdus seepicola]MCM1989299.1 glycosyltransferase family 2 protein [Oceanirhabdus seepicola]